MKRLNDEFKDRVISIVAINVDDESRLSLANRVIEEYGLTWPHVMNGKGEADPGLENVWDYWRQSIGHSALWIGGC